MLRWTRLSTALQNSITSLLQSCLCSIHCRISITTSTDSFLSWLLLWPLWSWQTGRTHWAVGSTEFSGTVVSCWMLHAEVMAPCSSFSETRHIGQVVCFCNHKSKQARWKLWRHVGMILRTSFSLYSPKHMEHWASSSEQKASQLYFMVGIAAITKGSNPERVCSL